MKYLKNYENFKNVNEITIIRDFFNHFQKNDRVIFDPPIEIMDENLFLFKELYLNEDDELSFSIGIVEEQPDDYPTSHEFDDNELLIGINDDFLKKICEELYNRKEYEVYFEADKFGL